MSSSEEYKTFNKASRWGHSRAATGRGAGHAQCGLHENGKEQKGSTNKNRLHQTVLTGQSDRMHVCVETCPLTTRHTAKRRAATVAESRND